MTTKIQQFYEEKIELANKRRELLKLYWRLCLIQTNACASSLYSCLMSCCPYLSTTVPAKDYHLRPKSSSFFFDSDSDEESESFENRKRDKKNSEDVESSQIERDQEEDFVVIDSHFSNESMDESPPSTFFSALTYRFKSFNETMSSPLRFGGPASSF